MSNVPQDNTGISGKLRKKKLCLDATRNIHTQDNLGYLIIINSFLSRFMG